MSVSQLKVSCGDKVNRPIFPDGLQQGPGDFSLGLRDGGRQISFHGLRQFISGTSFHDRHCSVATLTGMVDGKSSSFLSASDMTSLKGKLSRVCR